MPPDRGYYFDMRNCDIKMIRYTLTDNGFRDLPDAKELLSGQAKQPSAVSGISLSGIMTKDALR